MVVGSRKWHEVGIEWALFVCALVSVAVTVGIVGVLIVETIRFFEVVSPVAFFTGTEWTPLFVQKKFGVLPLFAGTFLTTVIAMGVAVPIGLMSAIYLSEYASERLRSWLKPVMELLAAVPTVVYGYFALLYVTPFLQQFIPRLAGFNALSPGIVMGVMIIPTIASLSEDALHGVPSALREAAQGLGATRWQTAISVVMPAAFSGVVSALLLGVARAIGETMIVAVAAGLQPRFTLNPLVPIETVTAYIVQVSLGDTPAGTLEYSTIFAVGMTLFVATLVFNIFGAWLRARFREIYD